MSKFEFWIEQAWLGTKCKGKTLLIIETFFTLHRYCTVTVQYWCSVSKAKHDQVFSAALLNGRKIQLSLLLPDCDLTWRVTSTTNWTLLIKQRHTFKITVYFTEFLKILNGKLTGHGMSSIQNWSSVAFTKDKSVIAGILWLVIVKSEILTIKLKKQNQYIF